MTRSCVDCKNTPIACSSDEKNVLQILSTRTFRYIFVKKYLPDDSFFKMESVISLFLVWMQSSVLYCEKAYNHPNIKNKIKFIFR